MQANAGADVLMIFDSWSHMIPNTFFKDCAIDPIAKIVEILNNSNYQEQNTDVPEQWLDIASMIYENNYY